MLSFENDYSRAAHPAVLEAVAEANNHLYSGYGSDELSDQAKAKIREACGQPDADVWFLVGGTQTNQVVIDTITPAYAGVVAVASGHPNVHEAGAIEFSGHKVLTIPQHNGKMDPTELDEFCKTFYADATTSTWCSRAPCTSRKAPNMAPSTPRPSCRPSPMWRTSTTCRCSWMARDSATR